jgi:hypothetical protein
MPSTVRIMCTPLLSLTLTLSFCNRLLTTNWIYNICHIFVLSGFKYSTIKYRFRHYKTQNLTLKKLLKWLNFNEVTLYIYKFSTLNFNQTNQSSFIIKWIFYIEVTLHINFIYVCDWCSRLQADIFSQHAAYLFYLFIFAIFAVYIAYLMLDCNHCIIHYTPCWIQRNWSALRAVVSSVCWDFVVKCGG